MKQDRVDNAVSLPNIDQYANPLLDSLTRAIGIDRNVIASEQQIASVWSSLPEILKVIPPHKRDERMMRMCVAVASGLFDAGINYAWNSAIIELRNKICVFGISIIPQIIGKKFDENTLLSIGDSELLSLCLKLNLISQDGYFMLNQCRDIRNNFSAAHPPVGSLNQYEFLNFLNRCVKHAISQESNTEAVDIKELIIALNESGFNDSQYNIWNNRINRTFDAQRETIFAMMHGIYCDSTKEEHARVNVITICKYFANEFSPTATSALINQHQGYQASGDEARLKASQIFFQYIGKMQWLSESERHQIVSTACKNLMKVHNGFDNFHNEPPFAEQLVALSKGHTIPETVKQEFVETIVTCSVGNQFGTSRAADFYYKKIIVGMSPKEIGFLLSLPETNSLVAKRLRFAPRCEEKFSQIVGLVDESSVPAKFKTKYRGYIDN